MLNLIAKDIKLLFGGKSSPRTAAIRFIGLLLVMGLLIFVETYVYREILDKLSSFPNAPRSFTTLFLFVISLLLIVNCLFQGEKLFYDEEDRKDTATLPITPAKRMLSKFVLLFLIQFVMGLALEYPIFLSFGMLAHKMIFFYFKGLLYPVLGFFFEAGIALILLYPFHLLKQFLSERPLAQFLVAAFLLGALAFAYGYILEIFSSLISGRGINALLTESNMAALVEARKYLVVSNYLVDLLYYSSTTNFLFYLLFAALALALGLSLLLWTTSKATLSWNRKWKKTSLSYKPMSPFRALLRKEFLLLFRDGENLFSYSGLLLVQPYLCYAVLKSLNAVFSSGNVAYYFLAFPGLATYIDIFAILCFLSCVSGAGMNYFAREKHGIRLIKTLPISEKQQMLAKWLPGFCCSLLSFAVTLLLIGSTKTLMVKPVWASAFYGLLFLFGESLLSMHEEMKRQVGGSQSRILSNLYSYGLPFVFLGMAALLSFLQIDSLYIYLSGAGLLLLAVAPEAIYFLTHTGSLWLRMEVAS